jgi:hypothetical protein
MTRASSILSLLAAAPLVFSAVSCRGKGAAASAPQTEVGSKTKMIGLEDLIKFRGDTRQLYNNRKFAELEALADKIRSGKERTPGGSWKIEQFYNCMECRDDEPESMWQLHEKIHGEWETKYPKSITAQVAKAEFYISYAWHARGAEYANQVTEEGWKLFRERLAKARTVLDQAKALSPTCPMWYTAYLTVALGQGWDRAEYDTLFKEATAFAPEFDPYDVERATYLLPRWHGKPGEWEKVAENEIALRGAAGQEIYACVIDKQAGYYDNIFKESAASWRQTRKGYDALIAHFPTSSGLLNHYCRFACLAGDREQAKKLFEMIGENQVPSSWRKNEFARAKAWAMGDK